MADRDKKEIVGIMWREFGKYNGIFQIWEQNIGKDCYEFPEGYHSLLTEVW